MSWASASDVLDRWVGPNRPTDQDFTIETLIADAEAFVRAEYPAIGQQITDGHVDVAVPANHGNSDRHPFHWTIVGPLRETARPDDMVETCAGMPDCSRCATRDSRPGPRRPTHRSDPLRTARHRSCSHRSGATGQRGTLRRCFQPPDMVSIGLLSGKMRVTRTVSLSSAASTGLLRLGCFD